MTLDDLIASTIAGQITWTADPQPVAAVDGTTVFVGHQVYARDRHGDWITLGPADDLHRAINDRHARENTR